MEDNIYVFQIGKNTLKAYRKPSLQEAIDKITLRHFYSYACGDIQLVLTNDKLYKKYPPRKLVHTGGFFYGKTKLI